MKKYVLEKKKLRIMVHASDSFRRHQMFKRVFARIKVIYLKGRKKKLVERVVTDFRESRIVN